MENDNPLANRELLRYTGFMARSSIFTTLFSRLMLFFLVVMLIPVSLLGFSYLAAGRRAVQNNLMEQSQNNIGQVGARLSHVVEGYRHKAYAISTNEDIVRLLQQEGSDSSQTKISGIYEQLFSIMKGDTYMATASVVSSSGRTRISTHLFPPQYDLRYQGNDTNPFFDLSRAGVETASLITLDNRYVTQNNAIAFMSILRKVRDQSGNVLGYVAVDILQETVGVVPSGYGFSDIILIDTGTFAAHSVMHLDKHGDFSRFPELGGITFPLTDGSRLVGNNIISLTPIANTQLFIAGVTDTTIIQQSIDEYLVIIIMVLAIGAMLAGILAYFFSRSIARPIDTLARTMHQVESGDLHARVAESDIWEISALERSFNTMVRQITTLMEVTREEEAKLQEAERKALEAQLNPHFLYNTLNTVKAIAKLHHEEEILLITTKLGKLLRNAIDNRDAETTLQESFALVESYLTIQRIRFGDKLHAKVELDESIANLRTPKLIIQPLVENALIHGLEPKVGIWRLSVKAYASGSRILITIADNGVGFAGKTTVDELFEPESQQHVGLYNIHRRLKLRYGDAAGLTIDSAEDEGTVVTIHIPSERKEVV
jgi:two-component system sensor histidine kinase YesM